MYLAAIADSQPQPQPVHPQVPPTAVLQPGPHYMHHQQAQQQMAQQSLMLARNQIQYTQQQVASLHQVQQQQQQHHHQQQHMHGQHGISSGGNSGLQMVSTDTAMTGNSTLPSGGFPDFGRSGNAGDGLQVSRSLGGEMRVGKPNVVAVSDAGHIASGDGNGASGAGQTVDEPEPSYLKAPEDGS